MRGGSLLLTPLRGIDGEVYAVAQGNLVVAGVKAEGQSGSSVTINVPTAGIIPNGAIIEREAASNFSDKPEVTLNLHQPNFKTARNVELDALTSEYEGQKQNVLAQRQGALIQYDKRLTKRNATMGAVGTLLGGAMNAAMPFAFNSAPPRFGGRG